MDCFMKTTSLRIFILSFFPHALQNPKQKKIWFIQYFNETFLYVHIFFSSHFSDPAYLRDVGAVAHIHPAALQNFHATSLASNSAAAAMNAANAAAAIAAAEVAHKRPRLDLSHPPQGPVAGSSNAGPASNSISQPLRIDTRDQPKVRPQAYFIQKVFLEEFYITQLKYTLCL